MINAAKIAQTFNSYIFYSNIIDTISIERDGSMLSDTGNETYPLMHKNKKSEHPRISSIRKSFKRPSKSSFVPVDKDILAKEIKNIDPKRVVPQDDIPDNYQSFTNNKYYK